MKIYTRTGDRGETGLFAGGRVPKDHVRVEAYGEVDELNALLGVVAAERPGDFAAPLGVLQGDLFAIGARLATPGESPHLPPLPAGRVAEMEQWIDAADAELPPLRNFILPGGTKAAAALHLARTVCRRAERRVITLARESPIDPLIVRYLNRLSDLLFVWARLANHRAGVGDLPWEGRPARGEESSS